MKQCPNCGLELADNNVCSKCGIQQKQDVLKIHNQNEGQITDNGNAENDFDTDVNKFIGKKHPYYKTKWEKAKDNKPTWNFAAFFLSIFWLGYRKMYTHIAIIIAFFFLIDFIVYILNINSIDNAISMAIAVTLGMYGNYFYLIKARKKVAVIREQGLTSEDKNFEIHKKGGTSWLGVFIALIFLLFYAFISIALFPSAEDKITALRDGTFYDTADQTVGETMDSYFFEPDWNLIKNDQNEEVIHFTGKKEESIISIDFISDGDSFEINNAEINGEQLTADEINEMLDLIITES